MMAWQNFWYHGNIRIINHEQKFSCECTPLPVFLSLSLDAKVKVLSAWDKWTNVRLLCHILSLLISAKSTAINCNSRKRRVMCCNMFHQNTPQQARCPSSWFKGKKPIPPIKIQFYILIFTLGSGSVDCHRYIAIYPGLASECDIWHRD